MIEGRLITQNPFSLPALHWREGRFAPSDLTRLDYSEDPLGPVSVTLPADLCAAVPKRRGEYLAGRICAALVLRAADLPERLGQKGRVPVWPAPAAGSISHAGNRVIAALSCTLSGLGVDCETIMPTAQAEELHAMILTEAEAALCPSPLPFPAFLTLAFSAKEALYKALSARLDRVLEFHDVILTCIAPDRLHLAVDGASYQALYRVDSVECVTLVQVPK
ncbi:4'-phosphopantetheinyl transferase [Pseudorhodobacter sp.]|uniref:4'-phosphopantetheinyl transferase family protein n=1 Tax=Pseudorhodobacter sp. TaxID=1934400 RepID=UPI0026473974|nr:4'-phosphopantetheinyl transferase superfamily protein [Pseudorhodobacter sp.]MDN5787589.1 4'-phosphopantetheinyl transferase superfamily protein [Pseudorhodobacter sp.]